MRKSAWVVSAFAGVLFGGAAPGQQLLQRWSGSATLFDYGFKVAALGDVDGDGIGDVALASLTSPVAPFHTEIRSTRDGALLLAVDDGNSICDLASAGDVDRDGADDLLIGDQSFVDVVSGKTGRQLLHIVTRDSRMIFGISVAGVGDVDGDGIPDVAAVAVLQGFSAYGEGWVTVHSGADGHTIHEFLGAASGENGFGFAIAALADLDGDGVRELAVGVPGGRSHGEGFVRIFSLKSGSELATVDAPAGYYQFGAAVAACRDLDGDAQDDLLVSGSSAPPLIFYDPNQVWTISGATRTPLAHLRTPAGFDSFGSRLAGAGDVNRDGVGDFLVATSAKVTATQRESARLYDGRTLATLCTFESAGSGASPVAGVPDVDGDGFDDLLVGFPWEASYGAVRLYGGDDLFLDATPTVVAAGDTLRKQLRTGVAGNLAMIALVAVNTTPLFLVVDGPAPFDAAGSFGYAVTVPPGLAGVTLAYQGFAINARGKLSHSAVETVLFQ
jgi:hypothetical protein